MDGFSFSVETYINGSSSNSNSVTPFMRKLYEMVNDPITDPIISWSSTNNSFVVWRVDDFTIHVLPFFFKHTNFSSFIRQLNSYGLKKHTSLRELMEIRLLQRMQYNKYYIAFLPMFCVILSVSLIRYVPVYRLIVQTGVQES